MASGIPDPDEEMHSDEYDSDDSVYLAWQTLRRKEKETEAETDKPYVEKPTFTEQELNKLVGFVKRMTTLYDLRDSDWTPECESVIKEFMNEPEQPVLTVFFEGDNLKCMLGFPTIPVLDLSYFFRETNAILTPENFHDEVTFGTTDESITNTLLQVVENVYAPMFFQVTKWPDTVKSEFCSRLHTFLGNLTDFHYKLLGITVLYIPREGHDLDIDVAVKDQELVKRLEAVVVQWTRQLRIAIGDQNQVSPNELLCPVDEYEFWIYRHENLSGILHQIKNPCLIHIRNILQNVQSTYVNAFQDLCGQIEASLIEAKSNIEYLQILIEPCEKIKKAEAPSKIPALLPEILTKFRVIWLNSPYYNTKFRITALCRALSNQIILYCKEFIDLDLVFEGKTRTAIKHFQDCIDTLHEYKREYATISTIHTLHFKVPWDLDDTAIFSNVDAFILRCQDMIEVCETMIVFGRHDETQTIPKPQFSGPRGLEFEATCEKVEEILNECVNDIKEASSIILDVQNTNWFEIILKFNVKIKENEVIIENLMKAVFDTISSSDQMIETLGYFYNYAQRPNLKFVYSKKTESLYAYLSNIIQENKNELVKEREEYSALLPYYAGRAMKIHLRQRRMRGIRERIEKAFWLPHCAAAEGVLEQFDKLMKSMEESMRDIYIKWSDNLGDDSYSFLDRFLLVKSPRKIGLYEVNFDRNLLDIFDEVLYWSKLKFDISTVGNIFLRADVLKFVYENMIHVVLAYNQIVSSLSDEERVLFKAPLAQLDKKLAPAVNQYKWSQTIDENYLREVSSLTEDLQDFLDDYKKCHLEIIKILEEICNGSSESIIPSYAFELSELKDHLALYRKENIENIAIKYRKIIEFLVVIFEGFEPYMNSMGEQWIKFIGRYDNLMETALKVNVKSTFQTLYDALHGDGHVGPSPFLKLVANLKENQINFEPSVTDVVALIANILPDIVEAISTIPRIFTAFHLPGIEPPPFHKIISMDEECLKIQGALCKEVSFTVQEIQTYTKNWDPFVEIWQVDKDKFLERYEQQKPDAAAFDTNIGRYTEIANNVSIQETITPVHFLVVNASELKTAIINHCFEWQNRLCALLKKITIEKINHVYDYIQINTEKIKKEPKTVEELHEAMIFYEQLKSEIEAEESEFPAIEEQIRVLDKYQVELDDKLRLKQQNIMQVWRNYLSMLDESLIMLNNTKEDFRNALLKDAIDLEKRCTSLLDWFLDNAPYSHTYTAKEALEILDDIDEKLNTLREEEAVLKKKLAVFNISQSENADLAKLEKDYQPLRLVWELTNQWDGHWEEYKTGEFWKINVDDMEDTVQRLFRKITRLSKELSTKNWSIVDHTKERIDALRRVLPLIGDLKNPAMRERHWNRVKNAIKRDFDETASNFTLEYILELEMQNYTQEINEISIAATGELIIENGIKAIAEMWETLAIQWQLPKDSEIYRLKTVDDITNALEDHFVSIATMKSTKFIQPFQKIVDKWEKTLSYVSETIENVLNVQRLYIYMENIFAGDDIKKQLPDETLEFENLRNEWKSITHNMQAQKNCIKACNYRPAPYLLNKLTNMIDKMEKIQRALEKYLETKRHLFPRFYFVSNDDLLEMLGNAKKPELIQPHLKKIFDGLYKLKINKHGNANEGFGMFAIDGEYIDFLKKVLLEGPVELWLTTVEEAMRLTLREQMKQTRLALKKMLDMRDKWLLQYPGQCTLTSSIIQWTADCTRALTRCKLLDNKQPLKKLRRKQNGVLARLTELTRRDLAKIARLKTNALITIEIHSRDVIDRMYKAGCMDVNDFEWFSQLRFYWERDIDDCVIRQTNTFFMYFYEYLGNSGRLVITPLTDRCYITLTTALHLFRGGSPKGPAGTGKTETVKDLGKAMGMWVIVINCSEGLDYKSMGKMFSGLSQCGTWGCFDEFNRINIEVLSVVAQQIMSILTAISQKQKHFMFEGSDINLALTCGIFITMNPGYAGRTELPDNLKSLFRPISMMTPDNAIIAENLLFSDGFNSTRVLSRKVNTLYQLATQQLSKQDHYDFGLRSMVALLRYAGKKRREHPNLPEEQMVYLAMSDMNIAKLTSDDYPLFSGIMSDIFPGVDVPHIDYDDMVGALTEVFEKMKMQLIPIAITKVIQLYETKCSRHSVMILGNTMTAKSVTWKGLKGTMTRLAEMSKPGFVSVTEYPINPKALSLGELYGEYNLATGEWLDGIISATMRVICAEETLDQKWILFDGPVDAVWIENMNSVMDDNKILTLINSERITMPEQVSLLFEVGDLRVASPATVSRCGMVYNDYKDWGWKPYVKSWIEKHEDVPFQVEMHHHFENYIDTMLEIKKLKTVEIVSIPELNLIQSLCRLLDCFCTPKNGCDPADADVFKIMCKVWFLFCMIWSVCITVDSDSRNKFDAVIREMEGIFPVKDTVYEYYVDVRGRGFTAWENRLSDNWSFSSDLPFYKITVPTVDTIRYDYVMSALIEHDFPSLIIGPVGTGKTNSVMSVIEKLDTQKYAVLIASLSAQTTSANIQETIESKLEKRTKLIYVPPGNKKLITFLDDLNMPAKETYGSQPPLELLRLWVDYTFWYDRLKQWRRYVRDMQLIAAMGPPGGGRQAITERFLSKFNVIFMIFPDKGSIKRIFGTMLRQHLKEFDDEVKALAPTIMDATLNIYNAVCAKMLPTPAKMHYLFNLRDISRIFQGLLRSHKDYHSTKVALLRLWVHECFRVFSDRLNDEKDQNWFLEEITYELGVKFEVVFHTLCPTKESPIFSHIMNSNEIYEDLQDLQILRKFLDAKLIEYNHAPGTVRINIVLFKDAIKHICRIVRVISQPRGNVLLVGVGGSGRQVLARLASFICESKTFKIEVTKSYHVAEFKEDLKKLYRATGVQRQMSSFLFVDTQIAEEAFLEMVNNMLSSGEVTNLYKKDEFEDIKTSLEKQAGRDGIPYQNEAMYNYFIQRSRMHMHILMAMSPIGEPFRNRLRQYPSLINCTTIDWFLDWPVDALLEVAHHSLADVNFILTIVGTNKIFKIYDDEEEQPAEAVAVSTADENLLEEEEETRELNQEELCEAVASCFAIMHSSVVSGSRRMLLELKRYNYVTPINYLELVDGYKTMLDEKRSELKTYSDKLRRGVQKIIEAHETVVIMRNELAIAQVQIKEFQIQCDEVLVLVQAKKKEADQETKEIAAKSVKIEEEEKVCTELAEIAQYDLDKAMPALLEAVEALNSLKKEHITEIRSYTKPPAKVEMVLEAVMILKGLEPTWAVAKKELGDLKFLQKLIDFPKDEVTDKTMKKIAKYTYLKDFKPEVIGAVSFAAQSLCLWVIAIEKYVKVYRYVAPKMAKLKEAKESLAEKQAMMAAARKKLQELNDLVEQLKKEYDEKMRQKQELAEKAEMLKIKLERAAMLLDGLSGEKIRWSETIELLEIEFNNLPGDVLLSIAFVSYCGPFISDYRHDLKNLWQKKVKELWIPFSSNYSIIKFLAVPTTIREWNIQGLPSDDFSTENGIIVSRCSRWPLIIDPQTQAIKWIRQMEAKNDLSVIDFGMPNYMKTIETSVFTGKSVLLQNIMETLEPTLQSILNKAIVEENGIPMIKINERMVFYHKNFRLFIATKMPNPHYPPEISTKTTLVNFAVKEEGLEAQLLGIVVRKEKPTLEEQKDKLVTSIAKGKSVLIDLENELLRLLYESQGSLIDNLVLINTLQVSKRTAAEVLESIEISEETEKEIDLAREEYRVCAKRASILFFVLNDLGNIDPMYQFSLDAYLHLFSLSIVGSPRSPELEFRLKSLNDYHTYAVYKNTCRALFEHHKLLFSLHMCMQILKSDNKLNMAEYLFLLKGGIVLNRENQPDNPCSKWLTDECWDNITEFDKLPGFKGVVTSFEQYGREWSEWYTNTEPENNPLIGGWEDNVNELQRMLFIRCLRPDRLTFCMTTFIINNLGQIYVEPPVLDIKAVAIESLPQQPLIFVLSPGVDPTSALLNLADSVDMTSYFTTLSLGQGQAPIATKMIEEGVEKGYWVYLANCHLSLSWMPALDKIIENLQTAKAHKRFRLWLSSNPTPEFPLSILQAGIKMTTEPPKGLKANLRRLYNVITDEQFSACQCAHKYKKLLFTLCFFHAILLERKKFQQLGWNTIYSFNDSDFEISQIILSIYLDDYPNTPWDALKYLIAGVNYGGHVTDDWDRRLLTTYINQYFCEDALNVPLYRMSSLATYYIPKDGSLESYQDYITILPNVDRPEAFGQHPNADISSLIVEIRGMLMTLVSIQSGSSGSVDESESKEDKVTKLANEILSKVPKPIDYEQTYKNLGVNKQPLDIVLLQEILRYNVLLHSITDSLINVQKGIKGFVVMSPELEEIFQCMFEGRVPQVWLKAYWSLKGLGSWTRDLVMRVEHFAVWAKTNKQPLLFWLAAYTFPTGFLTAVLQTEARRTHTPIDNLGWEFSVFTQGEHTVQVRPEIGVYVRGTYLEGAGWHIKKSMLIEPEPMKLLYPMPLIHFRPTEQTKRRTRGMYSCPCYYYPIRTGVQGKPSFIVAVDLKSGYENADYWIKRGTALLLSLGN